MNILFLDDDPLRQAAFRSRCPSAVIVATSHECIEQLKCVDYWDEVHLDHDLGGETYCDSGREDTGMEVVRWMVLNKPSAATVVVHTYNASAAPIMVQALEEVGYRVVRAPFRARAA